MRQRGGVSTLAGGCENQRQAEDRHTIIGERDRITTCDNLDIEARSYKLHKLTLYFEPDVGADALQKRDVAKKLNGVAEALLAVHEKCLSSALPRLAVR